MSKNETKEQSHTHQEDVDCLEETTDAASQAVAPALVPEEDPPDCLLNLKCRSKWVN